MPALGSTSLIELRPLNSEQDASAGACTVIAVLGDWRAWVSSSQYGAKSTVAEAQKYPAAFDSVRYCLFDSIYRIRRGRRLANAAGSDHLDQLS